LTGGVLKKPKIILSRGDKTGGQGRGSNSAAVEGKHRVKKQKGEKRRNYWKKKEKIQGWFIDAAETRGRQDGTRKSRRGKRDQMRQPTGTEGGGHLGREKPFFA